MLNPLFSCDEKPVHRIQNKFHNNSTYIEFVDWGQKLYTGPTYLYSVYHNYLIFTLLI